MQSKKTKIIKLLFLILSALNVVVLINILIIGQFNINKY